MTTIDRAQVESAIAAKQVQQAQIMAQLQANIGAMQALQALLPKDKPVTTDAEWMGRTAGATGKYKGEHQGTPIFEVEHESLAGFANSNGMFGGYAPKDHGEQ